MGCFWGERDNNSYVSTHKTDKVCTADGKCYNYNDVFVDEVDPGYSNTCGQTCYVACSCNTSNGWYSSCQGSDCFSVTDTRYAGQPNAASASRSISDIGSISASGANSGISASAAAAKSAAATAEAAAARAAAKASRAGLEAGAARSCVKTAGSGSCGGRAIPRSRSRRGRRTMSAVAAEHRAPDHEAPEAGSGSSSVVDAVVIVAPPRAENDFKENHNHENRDQNAK